MKLGLIQMEVKDNKEQNLANAILAVADLKQQGAELVILPEMFLCPYQNACFPLYAEAAGEQSYQRLAQVARENQVFLIGGSVPELCNGNIYNTSYIFDDKGNELGRHRKMHLFDIQVEGGQTFKESDTLSAGNQITVVDCGGISVGVCICFDMRFPELARLMALKGAQLIVVPAAFNMTTGPLHWELMFRQRAVDNQLFTIGVAPARNEKAAYVSYGNSIVVSPWGEIIYRMEGAANLAVVDIDLAEIRKVRNQLPLLSARRSDIYELTTKG